MSTLGYDLEHEDVELEGMRASAPKQRYPRADALEVARAVVAEIRPYCEEIKVCGSLRRMKEQVGDVEIVFIPKFQMVRVEGDLFAERWADLVEMRLLGMISGGLIEKRLSRTGVAAFGPKNKLVRHIASGIPVDLFATKRSAWWNYIVCRTGGAKNNVAIASAAQANGWKWHPYDDGFRRGPFRHVVQSERDVFDFVGLPYLDPCDRA